MYGTKVVTFFNLDAAESPEESGPEGKDLYNNTGWPSKMPVLNHIMNHVNFFGNRTKIKRYIYIIIIF